MFYYLYSAKQNKIRFDPQYLCHRVLKKLNRFDAAQVSNLRDEAANWQQQSMIVAQKLTT